MEFYKIWKTCLATALATRLLNEAYVAPFLLQHKSQESLLKTSYLDKFKKSKFNFAINSFMTEVPII